MNKAKNILAVWQPEGCSTHKLSKKIGEKFGVKATHTGTLDPMAEGVVIILLDDQRANKLGFAGWKKTYEFEMVFGMSTDSYDSMGIINYDCKNDNTAIINNNPEINKSVKPRNSQEFISAKISKKDIEKVLKTFKGNYTQEVPLFSAIKVDGKRLFHHAHEGNTAVKLPEKHGEIFNIELIDLYDKSWVKIVEQIIMRLKNIQGNFRQGKIITQWENLLSETKQKTQKVQVAKIRVTISRGMYVRSLSQDIAEKLGTKAFVLTLVRTANGKYTQNDCVTCDTLNIVFNS